MGYHTWDVPDDTAPSSTTGCLAHEAAEVVETVTLEPPVDCEACQRTIGEEPDLIVGESGYGYICVRCADELLERRLDDG